jgi:HPt (histidine-containing phosphotransfer) domain-containing protein
MPVQRITRAPLIDLERINEIGGLDNPDIRRILSSFIDDLAGYLLLIERLREEKRASEMLLTLHKLAGSARTCGFIGINHAVGCWENLANPYKPSLHSNLRSTVEASIEVWQTLVD